MAAERTRQHFDEGMFKLSGALQGVFRLREFTQDDGHVFCRPDQLLPELARFCRSLQASYRRFGFAEVIIGLSTRPPSRIGDDASVLLEHHQGRLPAWLAPEQAHVLPVSAREDEYAAQLARALRENQVRVVLTDAGERLASRVAEARRTGAAFVLVVGPQERTSREVSIS